MYACEEPGYSSPNEHNVTWDCNQRSPEQKGVLPKGKLCASGDHGLIYTWTQTTDDDLSLPPGTGFRVGDISKVRYLVLRAHYYNRTGLPEGARDDSALIMTLDPASRPGNENRRSASAIWYKSMGGYIEASGPSKTEVACRVEDPIKMYVYSIRIHTHGMGKIVSVWKISKDKKWSMMARADPWIVGPVALTSNNITLEQGDVVAARCVYFNTKGHRIEIA